MGSLDDTLAFTRRLQLCSTAEEVSSAVLDVVAPYGLTAIVAGYMPRADASEAEVRAGIFMASWPGEWFERYLSLGYANIDPVVSATRTMPETISWASVSDLRPSPAGRRVYDEAREFGLSSGLSVPVVTLERDIVLVSMAGSGAEIPRHAKLAMGLAVTLAVGRMLELSAGPAGHIGAPLTARERECMRWAADGKSEWEIGQILGISEHTSEKHLLNAKSKLGAVTRAHAVAEAIRKGYIA